MNSNNSGSQQPESAACGNAQLDKTPHSFPRESRLVRPAQFRRVFQQNSRAGDRYWTVLYRENQQSLARLGMAVAKKRAKRAVDRNRLKRLIRESFRAQQILPGVDVVVLPKEASVATDSHTLRKSLDKQWRRIAQQCAT